MQYDGTEHYCIEYNATHPQNRNEALTHATTRMNLENNIQSEIKVTETKRQTL
jgi:hypothetical protein